MEQRPQRVGGCLVRGGGWAYSPAVMRRRSRGLLLVALQRPARSVCVAPRWAPAGPLLLRGLLLLLRVPLLHPALERPILLSNYSIWLVVTTQPRPARRLPPSEQLHGMHAAVMLAPTSSQMLLLIWAAAWFGRSRRLLLPNFKLRFA